MNQSKFSLADVLSVSSALLFGFVCFLGLNFLNIGTEKVLGMDRTTGCVIIAFLCASSLFFSAYGAKLLKRTNGNFKISFVLEVIFLILFVLLALFFTTKSSPFTHYFTVSAQKSGINRKLQKSIEQSENMFSKYETYTNNRINLYKSKLKSVVAAKKINPKEYLDYGFQNNSVADTSQIATKMFTIRADLFPSHYSDTISGKGIKEVANDWIQDAKNATSSWKPIGIVGIVQDIEKNSNEWLDTLVTFSKKRELGEQADNFAYSLSFDNVKTYFTKLDSPSPLAIGLALLVYMLMLLSWFVTKRSTRYPGLKFLFGWGMTNDNEL